MALLVKICGITRVEDGVGAIEAGADWLGVIRHPKSPRWRPVEECARMIREISARTCRPFEVVGVYVDAPLDVIRSETHAIGLDRIQLHGGESPKPLAALPRPAIKVIPIRDSDSIAVADRFPGVDLLTDTYDPALGGGTGRAYDYELLRELVARRRVIVAGGLNPETVGGVVTGLRPWGVDVSSGVEIEPGIKDMAKVQAFIRAAREAARAGEPA